MQGTTAGVASSVLVVEKCLPEHQQPVDPHALVQETS